ncbi:hypothetical protein NUSPORA_00724 [Nucleospora cyclopteri]
MDEKSQLNQEKTAREQKKDQFTELIKEISDLPNQILGKVTKSIRGYRCNSKRITRYSKIITVESIKDKEKQNDVDQSEIFNYNIPIIDFKMKDFKNYLLYYLNGLEPYKQNKWYQLKTFLCDENLKLSRLIYQTKSLLQKILMKQDPLLSFDDAKEVSLAMVDFLDKNDMIFVYEKYLKE